MYVYVCDGREPHTVLSCLLCPATWSVIKNFLKTPDVPSWAQTPTHMPAHARIYLYVVWVSNCCPRKVVAVLLVLKRADFNIAILSSLSSSAYPMHTLPEAEVDQSFLTTKESQQHYAGTEQKLGHCIFLQRKQEGFYIKTSTVQYWQL